MSKSYKGEDRRAAAQAHRARRTARLDKFCESHDSSLESNEPSKNHAKRVDGRKPLSQAALDSRLARLSH